MLPKTTLARTAAASVLAIFALAAPARAQQPAAAPAQPVAWDENASKELAGALHHMHVVWNSGDIAALKRLMVGDNVLVSFELDPRNHRPVRLGSKAEIDRFIDGTLASLDAMGATTFLEEPVVNCRATANFGVCTEQCTIRVETAGGKTRTDRLWSTAVAVRDAEGWKWVQWHMSVASDGQEAPGATVGGR